MHPPPVEYVSPADTVAEALVEAAHALINITEARRRMRGLVAVAVHLPIEIKFDVEEDGHACIRHLTTAADHYRDVVAALVDGPALPEPREWFTGGPPQAQADGDPDFEPFDCAECSGVGVHSLPCPNHPQWGGVHSPKPRPVRVPGTIVRQGGE